MQNIWSWISNSRILAQEGSQFIKNQDLIDNVDQNKLKKIKNGIKCEKSNRYQDTLIKIKQMLEKDRSRLKLLEPSIENTAYYWLTTIPLMGRDFYLNKTTFLDNIRIRYTIKVFTTKMCFQFSAWPFL